ncbi:MAG: hypothetical protein ACFCD0_28645 [Gemmataceae bacterium]
MKFLSTSGWLSVIAVVVLVLGTQGRTQAQEKNVLTPEAIKKWGQAETLFTGELVKVQRGPVARSLPPIYTGRLQVVVDKVYRGNVKKGQMLQVLYSKRQMNPPQFPEGRMCLISMERSRNREVLKEIVELTIKDLNIAKAIGKIPLGWSLTKGKLTSPWATLKKNAWRGDEAKVGHLCAVTGRPALLVGQGIQLSVEKVTPKIQHRFKNPDGDGEYKITVKNTSTKGLKVPALLYDGKTILWKESLVFLCQGKVYPHPDATGVRSPTEATFLKPGESVSTVVHVFKLKGPMWPRGGYRLSFQFCLGEKSKTKSFYYYSRHHDPIRKEVQEKE